MTIFTGFINDVLCAFFLQLLSWCWGTRRKATIDRAETEAMSAFLAPIAAACSVWSRIWIITWGSNAASRQVLIVLTASTGRGIRQTCALTYVVYILGIRSTWWTFARPKSRSFPEFFPVLNSIYSTYLYSNRLTLVCSSFHKVYLTVYLKKKREIFLLYFYSLHCAKLFHSFLLFCHH